MDELAERTDSHTISRSAEGDVPSRAGTARRGFLAMAGGTLATGLAGLGGSAMAQGNPDAHRQPRRGGAPNGDCILETGAALLWQDGQPTVVHGASVRVRDDRIAEVSTDRLPGRARRVDMRNQLLLPGFISGHTHVSVGSYTRGVIEGGGGTTVPHEIIEAMDDDAIDALMAYNLLELLRSGVTTAVNQDHNVRRAYSYVRVASRWGARGYPSGMIPGIQRLIPIWRRTDDQVLFDSVPDTLAEIEENRQFGLRFNGAEDGRILPNMAPHATDTHTPETMQAILAAAKELGNGIHIHLAQSAAETERVRNLWGVTPVQWLEQLGFYEEGVFAAHMSGIELATDLPILARNNVYFATCPSGGGPGGTPQPWPETLAAGVKGGPAIDTHSNDMVENVKMSVIHGQARYGLIQATSPVPLARPTIEDAVNGATSVAASVLGRTDLGRIEVGAKADLVAVDVASPIVGSGAVSPRPLWNLLYAAGANVRNVLTDGNFQVYQGDFVVDDERRVVARGAAVVREMYRELEARGYFD
jgi:5-methylthioadenosine/S-adenosylhomocysteine deaminase